MDDVTIARALHVLSVVLWIGGVALVTTVLLPAVRCFKAPEERVAFFEIVEWRFAGQARFTTALAGFTGFYMVVRLDLWGCFLSIAYWWMHAMVGVWLLFTLTLFLAEPLFLHRWLVARAKVDPEPEDTLGGDRGIKLVLLGSVARDLVWTNLGCDCPHGCQPRRNTERARTKLLREHSEESSLRRLRARD